LVAPASEGSAQGDEGPSMTILIVAGSAIVGFFIVWNMMDSWGKD